ncbi:MAG: hypothetical protein H0X02_09500 [Nitrosomonas sp.]|nr:hypothetical protein [Nitrosomonas sp.]
MLKPCFLGDFVYSVASDSTTEMLKNSTGFDTPMLLTKAATDFILASGVLDGHQLLINHPSECFGILSATGCMKLIGAYINRNGFKHPVYTRHFAIDDKLATVIGDYRGTAAWTRALEGKGGPDEPKILDWNNQPTMHLDFQHVIHFVEKDFRHKSKLRFITPAILESIADIVSHFDKLRAPAIRELERRNGRKFS